MECSLYISTCKYLSCLDPNISLFFFTRNLPSSLHPHPLAFSTRKYLSVSPPEQFFFESKEFVGGCVCVCLLKLQTMCVSTNLNTLWESCALSVCSWRQVGHVGPFIPESYHHVERNLHACADMPRSNW